ncbi:hypothetical protein B9Z19DRAFT_1135613 [Tuber borchii]|uniref:HNH nuclease domain-containing protein n=1 Tax=Tuber borchii TaxID=42251 RepID=A0A2T6ZCS5_TUBBO|nr:hypothetical protein B9Z19DRAFT_1135613 [Tuber borchii]
MEHEERTLLALVRPKTDLYGQAFLRVGLNSLTGALREELDSPPPVDMIRREWAIATWVERLETIRVALVNFPTLLGAGRIDTPVPPPPTTGITAPSGGFSGFSAGRAVGQASSVQLLPRKVDIARATPKERGYALQRDLGQCVVTGKKVMDGWNIQAAHIIPHALCKNLQCRKKEFWLMMDFFFGVPMADRLFRELFANLNGPENLLSLDISVHSLFDNGHLVLTPYNVFNHPHSVYSTHTGSYFLRVEYPYGLMYYSPV